MALISDYASLTQAIADWTHRGDLTSGAAPFSDYFIQAAQAAIDNDVMTANIGNGIRFQETAFGPSAIANGTVAVPEDWLAPKDLTVAADSGDKVALSFTSAAWIYERYPFRLSTGLPAFVAREGSNLIFGPYPDSGYDIQGIYYAQAPLLSSTQTTNWMVTSAPDLILAYCMREASVFLQDMNAMQVWNTSCQQKLEALIQRDKAERYSAASLQINAG